MKLYIKEFSSFLDDGKDIKKELKQKYKLDTRRQDKFIHLALYGGQLLKEKIEIKEDDELYVTSGVGNVDIVQKTNTYIYKEHQALKLFDFINLLGNTTSYYVAKSLGMKGKNIFQISDSFTYINTLVSAYASMVNSKKDAIICSIDLISEPSEIIKRVMGVTQDSNVVSSVNYQKFSLSSDGAIAEIEFGLDEESMCNNEDKPFETYTSYMVNLALKDKKELLHVETCGVKKRTIKLKSIK